MNQDIIFKHEKNLDKNKLVELFNSVGWRSAKYPNKLYHAINNSGYVISAWKNDDLIGMLSTIDDGAANVFITYFLIKPEYQRQGIGTKMMNDFCKKYEEYGRRILSTTEEKEAFYKKFDFKIDGIVMYNKNWIEDSKE